MSETDFFCDSVDEQSLISFILGQGGRLVASRQTSTGYEWIDTWEAYLSARVEGGQKWALENERLFFVLFKSYQECPLELHLIESGYYMGTYSVSQRVGGPTMELLMSVQYERDGKNIISSGFISHYPTYKNTITGDMKQTSQSLIDQYKAIIKYLKKGAVTIKAHTGRKYVIGPHTYPRIKVGELVMGVQGLELPDDSL